MYEKNLDEAIDRTVRDMTHVAADDDAVARVMARLREAEAPAAGGRWMVAPRVVWAGAAALLLIAIVAGYSLRSSHQVANVPRVAVNTAPPAPSAPLVSTNKTPTLTVPAPSTGQATTARDIRGLVVTPSSIANRGADASEWPERAEMTPLESDITLASITPATLGDAPGIEVEPLITSSLQVDEIPVSTIELPPVSPDRQE
jgi:hypothetical protein